MKYTSEQQRKRGEEITYRMGGKSLLVVHQYLDYTRNLKLNREFSKEIQEIFSKMSNILSFTRSKIPYYVAAHSGRDMETE